VVAAEDHPALVAQEAQAAVLVYLDGEQMELEVLLISHSDIVVPEDQTGRVVVIVEQLLELHFMDLVVVEMIREPPHTMVLKALCD
jgi:hypothetical protein